MPQRHNEANRFLLAVGIIPGTGLGANAPCTVAFTQPTSPEGSPEAPFPHPGPDQISFTDLLLLAPLDYH